ncbi:hypothetical protein EU513_00455 [Yimella sp. RIT 621]|uniref:hypothetical protein n=1 Tax=Yimella sp. RIT 621 TaxID=2510323 RepID=UPI00101CF74F|nr:hypothetical protein [Yimella sp. RIT 621]RYG78816.1 hypothetical protein EU513_00455 [Yimella sp. RIT 621]
MAKSQAQLYRWQHPGTGEVITSRRGLAMFVALQYGQDEPELRYGTRVALLAALAGLTALVSLVGLGWFVLGFGQ